MTDSFKKLRLIYSSAVVITTLLALGFIRINLMQSSLGSMKQFTQSNQKEIANADTPALATKLNALLASEDIRCIRGKYKTKEFINFQKGSCASSLWVSESVYYFPTKEDLEIRLSFTIPSFLLFSALSFILGEIFLFLYLLKVNQQRIILDEKMKAVVLNISKQIAHDIRSPLSALSMVMGTLKEIPEDKRILIRNATQRINDIANDLLLKGQEAKLNQEAKSIGNIEVTSHINNHTLKLNTEFIPTLVDILVSEKRMQYREYGGLQIDVDLKNSFGAFAQINSTELKRVISNLVNNAVEAFKNQQGLITVGVKKYDSHGSSMVEIFVKDNGTGIPKHILEQLGRMGVTYGKKDTQSGSGLGVYHAKKTTESFGGDFSVESSDGHGTLVRIVLPLADSPKWFANKIDLTSTKTLISLDDDISIHQIWEGRLQSLGINDIQHIKFQSGDALEKYVKSNITNLQNSLFLIDYELLNQSRAGLDLIEDLQLERYSILVTSRYEEPNIQSRALKLNLPLLPKALAGFIPITKASRNNQDERAVLEDDHYGQSYLEKTTTPVTVDAKIRYDLCLIDDDYQLIHTVWGTIAKEKGLNIRMFATPAEFLSASDRIDRLTPIYIDVSLGNGILGTDFAHEVYKLGFTEINLATGYEEDSINAPQFVRQIVGKNFPELKNPLKYFKD